MPKNCKNEGKSVNFVPLEIFTVEHSCKLHDSTLMNQLKTRQELCEEVTKLADTQAQSALLLLRLMPQEYLDQLGQSS
jgi:hypothetical protein